LRLKFALLPAFSTAVGETIIPGRSASWKSMAWTDGSVRARSTV